MSKIKWSDVLPGVADNGDGTYTSLPEVQAKRIEKVQEMGYDVIEGDPHTLLLDFDGEIPPQYVHVKKLVDTLWSVAKEEIYESKTKGHYHCILKTYHPIESVIMRMFIRAALGSDAVREVANYACFAQDGKEPSRLFRPKKG